MTQRSSRLIGAFDRLVLARPRTVLVCVLVIVACLGAGARRFRLDASAETLILEGDRDYSYSRHVSERYGQGDFALLTYTPRGGLLDDQVLADLGALRDAVRRLPRVASVRSILDVPLLESPPIPLADMAKGLPTLENARVDRSLAPAELRDSPIYRSLLVSPDLRTTALLVDFIPVDPDPIVARRNEREDIAAIRAVMDRHRDRAELFLGGTRMIADDMITFIQRDLKVFGLGGVAMMAVMMGLIFRAKRWVAMPMLCCVASAAAMIGLLGWLDWPVTVISANFIALQLIITLAIAVHLVVRYRELLSDDPLAPNRRLVLSMVRLKFRPCVFAVLTTMAGFGSLLLSRILPVIMLGWMMLVGLTVSLVVTFLLLPAALMLLPKPAPSRASRWRASLTGGLARLTEKQRVAVVLVSAAVLVICGIGMSRLQVENRFIDYFHPSTEIHQGMKVIDDQLGGTTPLDVIVTFDREDAPAPTTAPADSEDGFFDEFEELEAAVGDDRYFFTQSKLDRVRAAHRYLDGLEETGKVLSLATALDVAERLNDGKPLDSFELAMLYRKMPEELRAMLIDPYASAPDNEIRLWVRVKDSSRSLRRDALLARLRAELPEVMGLRNDQVRLSGLLVLYNNMLQSLFGSQIRTLGLTVLLLSAMFCVLFRSWRIAMIAMAPNVLPVAVVLGVMGCMSIPLDMMTITIAAISVGIAVDDTIHYVYRFREEFAKDGRYVPTMHRCHESIGRAMYFTSMIITAGLLLLALSNFVPTVSFGLLTALAMVIALLADLTLLPAMMIIFKPFGGERE